MLLVKNLPIQWREMEEENQLNQLIKKNPWNKMIYKGKTDKIDPWKTS